jgi:hypothetical protein
MDSNNNLNDKLIFLSYNSTGFNSQRSDFLANICDNLDRSLCMISIQEHFLLEKNKWKIESLLPDDVVVYTIGSFKNNTQVRRGRGIGGLAQIWPKSLDHLVTQLPVPNTKRVQGSLITLPMSKVLWINTYFPGDPGNDNLDEVELIKTLSGITWLIENTVHDHIIWNGDINADFSRTTRHVNLVKEYYIKQQFTYAWQHHNIDFTYSSPDDSSFSCIDHFLYSTSLKDHILDAKVIHRGDNISGHSPIIMSVKVSQLAHIVKRDPVRKPKQNWSRATDRDIVKYKSTLNEKLNAISIPSSINQCKDIHCCNIDHHVEIENYIIDIIECIESSSQVAIPYRNQKHKNNTSHRKSVPGWNDIVQPYKDMSVFWYSTWLSAGKPQSGELYHTMRHSKNQYKYAKRRCFNAADQIKRNKFIEACLNGEKDLLSEIKKMKRTTQHTSAKIDGHSEDTAIANHFRNIYDKLYNRTGSHEPLQKLLSHVDGMCNESDKEVIKEVNPQLIQMILKKKLKRDKSDVESDMTTDCLINAPFGLAKHLSNFFISCLTHGYIPQFLLLCAIIMLVKSQKKALDDSNNYRGIAISSLFLKVFDWIILILFSNELVCDENQFGFQPKSSTVMCTWTVMEVVNWFLNNGSSVYACFLDYRKAFDLVNHVNMFKNLIDRNLNCVFIRLMIVMYISQTCYIKWGNSRSYSFSVTNGTRQGSVFSPLGGFSSYIDPLITSLRHSGIGCTIKGYWFGSFFYADDGTLLCPSISGLQKMVEICEKHANENNLEFSTDPNPIKSKTKCIAFHRGAKLDLPAIYLNGDALPWCERVVHVGNTVHMNGTMEQDICEKRAIYIDRAMELNQEFMSSPNEVKLRMQRLYNSHFTGSPLWNFSGGGFNKLCNSWNVNIRIMLDLPCNTHCWIVEQLDNGHHLRHMLFSRYIKFLSSIATGRRQSLKFLINNVSHNVHSPTGSNIRQIMLETGSNIIPGVTLKSAIKCHKIYTMPEGHDWKISLIKGIMEVREEKWEVLFDDENECLNDEDLQSILDHACASN